MLHSAVDSAEGSEQARPGIAAALKDLRQRNDVEAIVVRESSPGGSGIGSDLIWHELMLAKEQKPLVTSFGDVAASGGYYVALTGSPCPRGPRWNR